MMSLLRKMLNLCKPSIFFYYWKQYILVRKLDGRLSLSAWHLSFERGVKIASDGKSRIKLGNHIYLRTGTEIEALYCATISIGDNFSANKNCTIVARYGVTIGNNCMLAGNVSIYDHDHSFAEVGKSFQDQDYIGAPIKIGNNVWIGANVFISKGVNIGDNVIVGAGTFVNSTIPSNSIVYSSTHLIVKPLHGNKDDQSINT